MGFDPSDTHTGSRLDVLTRKFSNSCMKQLICGSFVTESILTASDRNCESGRSFNQLQNF